MASEADWTPVTPREKRVCNVAGTWPNPSGALIRALSTDIWVVERGYVDGLGLNVGGKMTIIRLSDGRLVIHSALPLNAELKSAIESLGQVSVIIAPNEQHVDFVGHWKKHFPSATALAPPGMKGRRKDIPFDDELLVNGLHGLLKDEAGSLDQVHIGCAPMMNETVLFHRPSRVLVLTDLVFTFPSDGVTWSTRLVHKWMAGLFWMLYKQFMVKDRVELDKCLDRIEAWHFETLIPTHGVVVTEDARGVFRRWHGRQ